MKNSLYQTILLSGIVILSLVVSSFTLQTIIDKKETKKEIVTSSQDGFALLELFTSQGCSSCPPADAVLAKYATQNNPNIIPLAFHVDYWNRLGWDDPFSKPEFSNRQIEYSEQLNSQNVYTPQLIINGENDVLGSDESAIKSKINQELAIVKKENILINKVNLKDNILHVEFKLDKAIPNSVVNIALVKKKEFTSIKRGENSGLKQTNYNIVYNFKTVSIASNNSSFEFNKEWISSDFIVVAYLQNSKTGKILTATKSEIQ